jgi:hypothetical protein
MAKDIGDSAHRSVVPGDPDTVIGADEQPALAVERDAFGSPKLGDEAFRRDRKAQPAGIGDGLGQRRATDEQDNQPKGAAGHRSPS